MNDNEDLENMEYWDLGEKEKIGRTIDNGYRVCEDKWDYMESRLRKCMENRRV